MNRKAALPLAAGLLAVLAASAVATRRGLVHVPRDHFGIAGDRVLPPGWHLASPFSPAIVLKTEGEGALPPLPVPNREGVKAEAILGFHYRVRVQELEKAARRREAGFHRLLESAAREALGEVAAPRSALELLDRAALDLPLSDAVKRRLEALGIEISSLRWELRLPEDFKAGALRGRLRELSRDTGLRVLLIGLDAADWASLDPLLSEGRLPNIKALLARGVRGPLRSYNPMVSPLLWTTLATGKGPDVHRVADFSVIQTKTGGRVPISSRTRKVKAIWNILSDLERDVAVVGWWASFPADRIRGVMVTDRVAALSLLPSRESFAGRPGYTSPADFLGELLPGFIAPADIPLDEVRRFADVTPEEYRAGLQWIAHPPEAPPPGKGKPPVQDPVGLLIKILAATHNYQSASLHTLERQSFDLAAVYFEGIDLVGHRFQHYRPPRMAIADAAGHAKFQRVVTEFYIHQDRLLGELLKRAGPEVTVMVVSDHGFKTGRARPEGVLPYTVDQPVEWHREEGVFILSGLGAAQGVLRERATLFDITPTLLALLGAPLAADMPGRVLSSALDPAFLRDHPPDRIPTYEGLGGDHRGKEKDDSEEVSAEMMAQLRALGYVGGDAPAPKPLRDAALPRGGEPEEDTTVSYHRNLATYYLSARKYEEAIAELLLANRREKLPKSYGMLAEAHDALGRKGEAMAALEEGWREVPESMAPDSILWYVQVAVDAGDPARGLRFLESHRDTLESTPAIRGAAQGILAEAAGHVDEAGRLYWSALRADPTLVAAARPLAAILTRRGSLETLRPILEAGLARSERIDEYHNLLGALDSRAGRTREALARFQRAAEISPADPRFALNWSLALMDLGRWSEAGEVLERALAVSPGADLHLALGNVRLQTRQPEAALAAFQQARQLGGDPARADLGIALSTLRLRGPDEALAFARDSLARNPDNRALQELYRDLAAKR